MKTRQWFGVFLLFLPILVLFVYVGLKSAWWVALASFGAVVAVAACAVIGTSLVIGD